MSASAVSKDRGVPVAGVPPPRHYRRTSRRCYAGCGCRTSEPSPPR